MRRHQQQQQSNDLIRDKDRKLRLAITVEEMRLLSEIEKEVGSDNWEGAKHPFVERLGLDDYKVEVAVASKGIRDKTTIEMERLTAALVPGDEDD